MKRLDTTQAPAPARDGRSVLDDDELIDGRITLREGPDLLVRRARPIVADLVGEGRIGVGTLAAPADPIVIVDRSAYRLDAGLFATPVSLLSRVRSALVVDSGDAIRFPIDDRVRLIDIARLSAHLFGATATIVAVRLAGWFGGVTAPTGIFGRTQGIGVGFVTNVSRRSEWQLSFLTSDRTFGGRVLDISIESAELTIWAPGVVYQARIGEETATATAELTSLEVP